MFFSIVLRVGMFFSLILPMSLSAQNTDQSYDEVDSIDGSETVFITLLNDQAKELIEVIKRVGVPQKVKFAFFQKMRDKIQKKEHKKPIFPELEVDELKCNELNNHWKCSYSHHRRWHNLNESYSGAFIKIFNKFIDRGRRSLNVSLISCTVAEEPYQTKCSCTLSE